MSATTLLVTASVIASLAAILIFALYYLMASKTESMSLTAKEEGYEDSGAYWRGQVYGRPRPLSWSIFVLDDAKSIGLRYIFTSLMFLFIAGSFGVLMRVSLFDPNPTIILPIIYNILMTQHAILMIYMFAVGAALGFGYYLLPAQLRLKRDNMGHFSSVAYWLWLLGGVLFIVSRSSMRWYMYPPLSLQLQPFGAGAYNWLAVIAMELVFIGISMASAVVLKVIFIDRADDIPLAKMPIFAWSVVFTLIMLLSSDGPLMVGLGMLFYDFFNPVFFTGVSSTPLTFAILFWFWGHPIVYIAILPYFGLMYDIITRFSKTPIYSYFSGVFSFALLMVLSELVWGHHLLNSGLGVDWIIFFTTTSFLVVIPSALTIFNMIGTLWTAKKIRLTTPMLFVINAIFDFVVGGVLGVMLATQAVNETAHGTYFVTGHFHFVFVGLTLGVTMATFYLLYPSFSNGRVYNERLAKWHFYITAVGSFLMSISWAIGGYLGMPRSVAGYFAQFQPYQDSAIIGGVIIGIGQLVFLYNIASSWLAQPTTDPYNILENRTETNQEIGGGE